MHGIVLHAEKKDKHQSITYLLSQLHTSQAHKEKFSNQLSSQEPVRKIVGPETNCFPEFLLFADYPDLKLQDSPSHLIFQIPQHFPTNPAWLFRHTCMKCLCIFRRGEGVYKLYESKAAA